MGNILYIIGTGNRDECLAAAVNLSICLSRTGKGKLPVALLSLNSNSCDELEVLLNLRPQYSIENLQDDPAVLPVKHDSGVAIAGFSGYKPREKEAFVLLSRRIASIADNYSYTIIVSTQPEETEVHSISAISAMTLLLINPELLSLRSAKAILNMLESGHFSTEMLKPVLLEGVEKNPVSEQDIIKYFNLSIFSKLTVSRDSLLKSINTGIPEVLSDSNSRFSYGINKTAQKIADILSAMGPAAYKSQNTGNPLAETKTLLSLRNNIHDRLIKEMDLRSVDLNDKNKLVTYRAAAKLIIENLIANISENDIPRGSRPAFIHDLLNDVFGLGCLEEYLNDPAVTEIMVNGHSSIFVEKQGKIERTNAEFPSQEQLRTAIERIVSPVGRRIDESSPIVDARLADGSRVNAVIHPISLTGPVLTIRKFSKKKLTVNDLIDFGALTGEMADFIKTCVLLRKNIIVSGGTGSGKTTLLNVISSFIPADERIITIEDSAELKLPQEHVVRLEARPQSIEGTGEIPIRKLVINALRMRPDRIVVGECRAGEALDMLQAMNTGHDGSLTTLHANSPKDAVSRISTMVMMAGMELPDRSIKEQIASAVNIIIQLSRLADGSRKVIEIAETAGMKNGSIELIPILKYAQTGISKGKVIGSFMPAGNLPSFFGDLNAHGLELDKTIFDTQGKI